MAKEVTTPSGVRYTDVVVGGGQRCVDEGLHLPGFSPLDAVVRVQTLCIRCACRCCPVYRHSAAPITCTPITCTPIIYHHTCVPITWAPITAHLSSISTPAHLSPAHLSPAHLSSITTPAYLSAHLRTYHLDTYQRTRPQATAR